MYILVMTVLVEEDDFDAYNMLSYQSAQTLELAREKLKNNNTKPTSYFIATLLSNVVSDIGDFIEGDKSLYGSVVEEFDFVLRKG